MADVLDLIAQSLLGADTQAEIKAENPYFQFGSALDQVANLGAQTYLARKEPTGKDLRDVLLLEAATGLIGGGLESLGKDYQAEQSVKYRNLYDRLRAGETVDLESSGLSKGLYDSANRRAKLWVSSRQQKLQDMKDELDLLRLTEAVKSKNRMIEDLTKLSLSADDPRERARAAAALEVLVNNKKPEPIAEVANEESAVPVTSESPDPKFEEDVQKYGYDYAMKMQEKRGAADIEKKDWFSQIPVQPRNQITSAVGVTAQLDKLAKEFESDIGSWTEWQAKKEIGGTRENELYSQMLSLVPTAARLFGEVGNLAKEEQQRVITATLGGITSGPQAVAQRLRNLATMGRTITAERAKAFKVGIMGGGDALLAQIETSASTSVPAGKPDPANFKTPEEYKAAYKDFLRRR